MDRNQTLGLTQLPPDDEVEDEEGDEGEKGGGGDPGPGRVPHDVVLRAHSCEGTTKYFILRHVCKLCFCKSNILTIVGSPC